MNGKSKLSVIIPCYNVEKYIDRCVESLVNQTFGIESMELIFVDDASTDGTVDKLMAWEKRYEEHIMVIACEENGKQGRARNIGLQYATGEYIGFVDADDYIDLVMYDKLYQKITEYQCDVVTCDMVREHQDGTVAISPQKPTVANCLQQINTQNDRKQFMIDGMPGGVVTKIYRHALLKEHQLSFPEELCYEDNFFSSLLKMYVSSCYVIDEPYYHYVVNQESTVMTKNSYQQLDRLVIETMKVEEFRKRGFEQHYYHEIEFQFLKLYFINTIRMIFVRFDTIPYDIIPVMQETVRELFPKYQKNPYLDKLPPIQREILKLVDISLSKDQIDLLAQQYRKELTNHH